MARPRLCATFLLTLLAGCSSADGASSTGEAASDEGTADTTGDAVASTSAGSSTTTVTSVSSSSTTSSADSSGSTSIGAPDVPDPKPDPPTAEDYCESIVDSFCDFYIRCGRMDVASAELCHEPFLESCNAVFEPQYVGLETAGLLELSAEGLAACDVHLAEVACEEQTFELTGPCSEIWTGAQASGEACGLDVEYYVCDPSAACTISIDFCGTCETLLEPGEDCTGDDTTCGPEGFCDSDVCRARVVNGDPCTPDDRCMAGSACIDGACEGPTFVGLGDACDAGRRCQYLTACIGGMCSPTARLGESCSNAMPCEAGFCDGGVCQAPLPDGDACGGNSQCSSGLCIEDTCGPRPSPCITN